MRSVKFIALSIFCLFILGQAVDQRTALTAVQRNSIAGPTITVTSPKAGASVRIGSPMAISWNYAGNIGPSVRIFLKKNNTPSGSMPLISVTLDGSGSGSCNVPVPKDFLPGNDYVILVESNQNPVIKGISGLFSLVAAPGLDRSMTSSNMQQARLGSLPLIVVNEPTSADEWWSGHSFPLRWTNKSGDNSFQVNIELMKGDATLRTLGIGIPVSQGNFNCQIPESLAIGQYRIHIASTPDGKVFGTSDVFPIIKPGLTVLPMSKQVYNFYGPKMGQADDKIPFAWTYIGKIGSQVSITWVPEGPVANQKAASFVIVPDCSIGQNGKGQYLWNDIIGTSNLIYILRGQPEKRLFGHVEIKVIGTNFFAKSIMFTLILNE
jgi:hypothetical protein